jgi:hypothetical protein
VISGICPKERLSIFEEVHNERVQQDAKHGGPEHDDLHTQEEWTMLVAHHNTGAWLKSDADEASRQRLYRQQMLRVAALAIASVESFDRKHR